MLDIGRKSTKGKPFCFLLYNKVATPRTRRGTFVHKKAPEFHLFACEDENDQLAWYYAIKAAMTLAVESRREAMANAPSPPMVPLFATPPPPKKNNNT